VPGSEKFLVPSELQALESKVPSPRRGGGVLQISSDGDGRMEANIKTQTNPWTKNQPPKNSMPNFRASTILFVHYSQNYAAGIRGKYHKSEDCFEYPPQKTLLKSSHPKNTSQIFLTRKNPTSASIIPVT